MSNFIAMPPAYVPIYWRYISSASFVFCYAYIFLMQAQSSDFQPHFSLELTILILSLSLFDAFWFKVRNDALLSQVRLLSTSAYISIFTTFDYIGMVYSHLYILIDFSAISPLVKAPIDAISVSHLPLLWCCLSPSLRQHASARFNWKWQGLLFATFIFDVYIWMMNIIWWCRRYFRSPIWCVYRRILSRKGIDTAFVSLRSLIAVQRRH